MNAAMEAISAGKYAAARTEYEQGLEGLERELAGLSPEARAQREYDPLVYQQRQTAHYNLACIYALQAVGRDSPNAAGAAVDPVEAGRCKDVAFTHLGKAIDAGWRDVEHTIADGDLAALRGDPRWEPILQRMR